MPTIIYNSKFLLVYSKKIANLLPLTYHADLLDTLLAQRISQLTLLYIFSAFSIFFVNNSG